jgi:hypothetical protein
MPMETFMSFPDTFPPIPDELIGKQIDTVIIFDPETFEETIKYVESNPNRDRLEAPPTGIDTIIIFNPETLEETVIIKNHDTMEIDTLK